MEQVIALAAVGFLGSKIIEMLKFLRNKDWNGAFTLFSVMAVGVVVIFIAASASVTKTLVLPGTSAAIGDLEAMSKVFLGLVLTSLISVTYDFKKAIDNGDSAKQPPLTELPPGA